MKYSGEQVLDAGKKLLRDDVIHDDTKLAAVLEVLSYWRSEHAVPLEKAFKILQATALQKDRRAIFAKRLKRLASITKKLRRFDKMSLKNMQDIGGCRAILTNRKKLYQTLRDLKRIPEFRWPDSQFRVKDYIEKPKDDGYRSVHIIGLFPGETATRRRIEVQLRTYLQHYWATALEIVDLFTHQALKSNQGDAQWRTFFQAVSEHFALMDDIHLFESMPLPTKFAAYRRRVFGDMIFAESAKTVRGCCKKLHIVNKLEAFAASLLVVGDQLTQSNRNGYCASPDKTDTR